MWLRIAMRLATSLTAGGHDDDALLVLADLKDTVQGNARLVAFAALMLLDVYKSEAEIRIRKRDFEQIAALHKAANARPSAENPAAMAVINECFAVSLILGGQYALADKKLTAAAAIHADERSVYARRCRQLLAMNAALRAGPDGDQGGVLQTDSRAFAASELARRYQTDHGDEFLTEAHKFLDGEADSLVACVLEQWTSKVRKAQAEMKQYLEYALD
ncbi:hypothetical protein AAVH_41254, partial [Aphelenchoides avenae]